MITFDRQGRSRILSGHGSWEEVLSFSDPVRPPGGGVGRPKPPPPPPNKSVSEPQKHFWKHKIGRETHVRRLRYVVLSTSSGAWILLGSLLYIGNYTIDHQTCMFSTRYSLHSFIYVLYFLHIS